MSSASNLILKSSVHPALRRLLVGALLLLIVFAMGLRLVAADLNVYFDRDEVRKLMRTSGFTAPQLTAQLMAAEPMPAGRFVEVYQYASPLENRLPGLEALKANREHPPLYYLLLQGWLGLFGQWLSPKVFAALVTVVTLPALYWLTVELLGDRLAGLISMAIFAVSPLMFSMSQHVSQYSLLGLLTCLSTALFMRAYRSGKGLDWGLYGVATALGFYTHLFFLLLPAAHGAYALLRQDLKQLRNFVLASVLAGLSFVPWAVLIASGYGQFEETSGISTPPELADRPGFLTCFADGVKFIIQLFLKKSNISLLSNDWAGNSVAGGVAMVIFVGMTVWLVRHRRSQDAFLLILTCLYLPTIPIMVLDSFLAQGISAKVRYYLPAIMVWLPLLGFWLAAGVRSRFRWRRRWVTVGLLGMLLVSLASTGKLFMLSLSDNASGPQYGAGYQQAAAQLNAKVDTLVISYEDYIKSLIFSHHLPADTDYWVRDGVGLSGQSLAADVEQYRERYDKIFVFSPSQSRAETFTKTKIDYQGIPEIWSSPVLYQILP